MTGHTLPHRCPSALVKHVDTLPLRQRPGSSTQLRRNTITRHASTLTYNLTSWKTLSPTTATRTAGSNTATTGCPTYATTNRPFHSAPSLISHKPSHLPRSFCPTPISSPTTYSANTPAATTRPTGAPAAAVQLPFSSETARAVRAAKEQSAPQGLMFAGPDQLLLGILATAKQAKNRIEGGIGGGGGGGSRGGDDDAEACSAAVLLEAALGGGDVDSVREWVNEQSGVTAPMVYGGAGGGGGGLLPSDVDFAPAARRALALAGEGAAAMGSRSVGTYHVLMVLMTPALTATAPPGAPLAGGPTLAPEHPPAYASLPTQQQLEEQAAATAAEAADNTQLQRQQSASELSGSSAPGDTSSGDSSSSSSSGADKSNEGLRQRMRPGGGGGAVGELLPALLRVAGVDVNALYGKLLALAERDPESPPRTTAEDAYEGVVTHLRTTYQQQQQLVEQRPGAESRREEVEAALRRWPSRPASATDKYGSQQAQPYQDDQDDVYE